MLLDLRSLLEVTGPIHGTITEEFPVTESAATGSASGQSVDITGPGWVKPDRPPLPLFAPKTPRQEIRGRAKVEFDVTVSFASGLRTVPPVYAGSTQGLTGGTYGEARGRIATRSRGKASATHGTTEGSLRGRYARELWDQLEADDELILSLQ